MAIPINPKQVQPKQGTGFTNIGRVLQANRPGQLGQTLANRVGGTVQQSQGELNKQRSEFDKASQAAAIGTEEQQKQVGAAIADPTKATQEQQDLFGKIQQGYQGPQGLANETALQAQQARLGAIGRSVQSQGGRQSLLQRYVGGPNYTSGQQRMDTLLLGGANLKGVGRQALQGQQALQQGQTGAQLQAQNLREQGQRYGQQVQEQLKGAAGSVSSELQSRRDMGEAEKANAVSAMNKLSKGETLSDAEYNALDKYSSGVDLPQAGLVGGLKLLGKEGVGFVNQNALNLGKEAYATDEDISRINALQKLAGGRALTDLNLPAKAANKQGFGDIFDVGQLQRAAGTVSDQLKQDQAQWANEYQQSKDAINSYQNQIKNVENQIRASASQGYTDVNGNFRQPTEAEIQDQINKQTQDLKNNIVAQQQRGEAARTKFGQVTASAGADILPDEASYGTGNQIVTGLPNYRFQTLRNLLERSRKG